MLDLDKGTVEYLRSLVRMDLRKHYRGRLRLQDRFGTEFDPTESERKLRFIEQTYRALGGDVSAINNYERE